MLQEIGVSKNMTKKELNSSGKLSDFELIEQIRQGNRNLIKELYSRYASKIYRKCFAIVKNQQEAEDLAHDILIKILTKLNTFKGNSTFSLWIHSVTYNHCINYIKRSRKISFQEPENWDRLPDDGEEEVLAKQHLEIQIEQLKVLMDELKIEERLVLTMFYKDNLSIRQISEMLEASESAIKMRLKRSRDKLYNLFKNSDDGAKR